MRNQWKFFLIGLFLVSIFIPGRSQNISPVSGPLEDELEITRNINYISYGGRQLLLDVYRPKWKQDEKLAVIIVVRGGGWKRGDKEGFGKIASGLAKRGLAAVCIEYRPQGEALYPAAVFDIKNAIRWVKENAKAYNFDENAVGMIGGSAGAHLVLLAGLTGNVTELNPDPDYDNYGVQAIVAMATPTDFTQTPDNKMVESWLGTSFMADENLWYSASPVKYINREAPPALFMHGSSDSSVPYEQSISAIREYGKCGIYSELVLIPHAPHAFWNTESWQDFTLDRAAQFFNERLGMN